MYFLYTGEEFLTTIRLRFPKGIRECAQGIIIRHSPVRSELLADGGAPISRKNRPTAECTQGPALWRSVSLSFPARFGFWIPDLSFLVVGVLLVSFYTCRRTSDLCKQPAFIGQYSHIYILPAYDISRAGYVI